MISLAIYVYSKSTLINDYLALEKKEMVNDIKQTRKTFNSLMSSLNLINNDWSQWDDAYHFMQNKNNAFVKSNLAFTTFENAKINLILFFDNKRKLFYGLNYDLNNKKFSPIPQDLLAYLESDKSFTKHVRSDSNKTGILKTKEGYVVLSSLPILTSEGKGPILGALVMGYFFTDRQLEQLSDIVNMQVNFFPLPLNYPNKSLASAYATLKNGAEYYIAAKDTNNIYGFTLINDINNNPIGILRIASPQSIYNQGLSTINRYLAITLSVGLLFIAAIWYLLRIFVLDRIISVSRQVVDISSQNAFSQRIKISGKDEIENMVEAINSLMEIIDLTEEQLKYRIFLRTEELGRLSQLNKNLYTEMDRQKDVTVKLRQGEKILKQMAYYDALTSLPNRLFFHEIFQKMLIKSKCDRTNMAILFLDADKLKGINDKYGHARGDKFLRYTAQQLKKSISENDIVARLAGDEFIICITDVKGKSDINRIAETVLKNISMPLKVDDIEIKSTFSIGISIYPIDGSTIEELEKHADLAMYYAKKQPGNAYCYYGDIVKEILTEKI